MSDRTIRIWKGTTVLLCTVVLFLSIVMFWHSISGNPVIGCGVGSSCDSVLSGKWSMIAGIIPVSGLAVLLYIVLITCLLYLRGSPDEKQKQSVWAFIHMLCGAIIGSAVWFIILQSVVIHSFCKYCMAAHVTGIVLSTILFVLAKHSGFAPKRIIRLAFLSVGLMLAVVMALVQWSTLPGPQYQTGQSEEPLPAFSASDYPHIGPADAPTTITVLFDYQCLHCQKLHSLLPEMVERFDNKVVFVLCPVPLSPACNPYIPAGDDHFVGSCELARLALNMWQIDKAKFHLFDEWLFQKDNDGWHPRSVTDAEAFYEQLIGSPNDEVPLDGWIEGYLRNAFELFGRTSRAGESGVPRLIYNQKWLIPEVGTSDELFTLLHNIL